MGHFKVVTIGVLEGLMQHPKLFIIWMSETSVMYPCLLTMQEDCRQASGGCKKVDKWERT